MRHHLKVQISLVLGFATLLGACQPLKQRDYESEAKLFGRDLGEKNRVAGAGWVKEPLQLNRE